MLAQVVVAHNGENMTWLETEIPGLPITLVPGGRGLKKAKGREATAYLTYIIENYDLIPDSTVFM